MFRFNRRTSENRGLLFWRLVCSLMDTEPEARRTIRNRKTVVAIIDQAAAKAVKAWQDQTDKEKNRARAKRRYQRKKNAKPATGNRQHPKLTHYILYLRKVRYTPSPANEKSVG